MGDDAYYNQKNIRKEYHNISYNCYVVRLRKELVKWLTKTTSLTETNLSTIVIKIDRNY